MFYQATHDKSLGTNKINVRKVLIISALCSGILALLLALALFRDYESFPGTPVNRLCSDAMNRKPVYADPRRELVIGGPHSEIKLEKNQFILTFDDGPMPYRTSRVANVLVRNCVGATFFTIGAEDIAFPWLTRKLHGLGFSIGSHSFFHRHMTTMADWRANAEISYGFYAAELAQGTGESRNGRLFRFPRWEANEHLLQLARRNGAVSVFADITPGDWRGDPARVSYARFQERLKSVDRGIIVLHDVQKNTPELLQMIINAVKLRGGSFSQLKVRE